MTDLATAYRGVRVRAAYEWVNGRADEMRPDLLVVAPFTPRVAALVA